MEYSEIVSSGFPILLIQHIEVRRKTVYYKKVPSFLSHLFLCVIHFVKPQVHVLTFPYFILYPPRTPTPIRRRYITTHIKGSNPQI